MIFAFKSYSRWFKDGIWPGDLKNFDILCLAGYNYFLSIWFEIDVVTTDSWVLTSMFAKTPKFGLHATKGNEGFREFALFLRDELIGARAGDGIFFGIDFTLASKYKSHFY